MPSLGRSIWHQSQYLNDEPSHPAAGLDTKKKTLGATERNETARSIWRAQMKQVDATQLVIVDETGSNIGLTPLYAYALRGERAYRQHPAQLREEYHAVGLPFSFEDGSRHDFGGIQ